MDCSPGTLLDAAKCFLCMDEKQLLAIQAYLLCQLAGGGGGGGTSGASLQYVAYTVAPPPNPLDITKFAEAFDPTGNLSTLFWYPIAFGGDNAWH